MNRRVVLRVLGLGSAALVVACATIFPIEDDLTFVPDDAGPPDTGPPVVPRCEADVANDPTNCGACDFTCADTTCTAGLCGGQLVADNQDTPVAMELVGTSLYWLNRGQSGAATGSVQRCTASSSGCAPLEVVRQAMRAPGAFGVVGANIFFAEQGAPTEISRCAAATCSTTIVSVASGEVDPVGVTAVGERAVWTVLGNGVGALHTTNEEDGGVSPLVSQRAQPTRIVAVGEPATLYWLERNGGVYRCTPSFEPALGCVPVLVPGTERAMVMEVDDTYLYWVRGSSRATLLRVRLDGSGAAEELSSDESDPVAIASDGVHFYWANRTGGALPRCPVAGCAGGGFSTLAEGLARASAIAIDDAFVYVATLGDQGGSGQIKRMPK